MRSQVDEYLKHFSKDFSKEIIDYATNVALVASRYIFVKTINKQQYGYCTHCNSEFPTHLTKPSDRTVAEREYCGCPAAMYIGPEYEKHKHGEEMECPVCKSNCIVRYAGLGHSRLHDYADFVYYEKSITDPKVLVARNINAYRDYSSDYKNVKTNCRVDAHYIFEYKKGGKMIKYINDWQSGRWTSHLGFARSVHSFLGNQNRRPGYSRESIEAAVKGTPFAWSGWQSFDYQDMIVFFDLYARYPVIEYLNKLGYQDLVKQKLRGEQTYNIINWHGKSINKVLKLSSEELNTIKQLKIPLSFWFLNLIKLNKENQWNLSISEIDQLSDISHTIDHIDSLKKMVTKTFDFKDTVKYAGRQFQKHQKFYYSLYQFVRDWEDYKADCIKLGYNMHEKAVLYPHDLRKAHQSTISQIKYIEDLALNEKIKVRVPELSRYCFSFNGLLIRPAESAFEMTDEGKALNHCVGRYAEKHAEGKSSIFFIRRIAEPDKPYYTLELSHDNEILQTRGKSNCSPNEEVKDFLEEFKAVKLKNKKTKIRISA